MHRKRPNSERLADPTSVAIPRKLPITAAILAVVQLFGVAISAIPSLRALFAVSPDAIFRHAQVWRLLVGPFIESELTWQVAVFNTTCVFVFAWHVGATQGLRRLLTLFFGGSVFAAALWSVAALVWTWHRPLFSPVAATTLAVAALMPGLRRPFPEFLPVQVPVWVAFVAYAALWEVLTFGGAIDLSAHFLAGLFAVLVSQSGSLTAANRTVPYPHSVTTQPEQEDVARELSEPKRKSDSEFDRRVDDLLRKITETGYDSLAEDEIALLLEASQRYRNRSGPASP